MANADEFDSKLLDAALQVDWGMHNLIVESMGNRMLDERPPAEFRQDQDDPPARPLAALPAAGDGGAPRVIDALSGAIPTAPPRRSRDILVGAERRALGL